MPPGQRTRGGRRTHGKPVTSIPIVLWTGWGGLIDRAEVNRLDVQVVNKAEVSGLATVIASMAEDV